MRADPVVHRATLGRLRIVLGGCVPHGRELCAALISAIERKRKAEFRIQLVSGFPAKQSVYVGRIRDKAA